jgi:hypothetical protein
MVLQLPQDICCFQLVVGDRWRCLSGLLGLVLRGAGLGAQGVAKGADCLPALSQHLTLPMTDPAAALLMSSLATTAWPPLGLSPPARLGRFSQAEAAPPASPAWSPSSSASASASTSTSFSAASVASSMSSSSFAMACGHKGLQLAARHCIRLLHDQSAKLTGCCSGATAAVSTEASSAMMPCDTRKEVARAINKDQRTEGGRRTV